MGQRFVQPVCTTTSGRRIYADQHIIGFVIYRLKSCMSHFIIMEKEMKLTKEEMFSIILGENIEFCDTKEVNILGYKMRWKTCGGEVTVENSRMRLKMIYGIYNEKDKGDVISCGKN